MAIATIAAPTDAVSAAAASLKLTDLLQVLLTELTNQDPLKPVDNKDFMAQIAQFASLDSTQQLNANIQNLVSLQAVSQSVGLIGRTVTASTPTGTVTGKVGTLSLTGSVPTLTLTTSDGSFVPNVSLSSIQTVF